MAVESKPCEPEVDDELNALIEEARRRARRRRLGIAASLAAAGLALWAIYLAFGNGDGGGGGTAASQESGGTAAVEYTRTKSLGLGISGSYSFYNPFVTEAWVRDDGAGRLRTTTLPAEWPGPRDHARAVAAKDDDALKRANPNWGPRVEDRALSSSAAFDDALGGESFPATDGLSSDPAELRHQLEAFVSSRGGPKDARVFEVGSAVLGKPDTPAPVRAAVFKVLTRLPGVAVDRAATDPRGRSAVSASFSSGYTGSRSTVTVYFDPARSLELAYTDRLERPQHFIDARLLNETILTKARTVSSIPEPGG